MQVSIIIVNYNTGKVIEKCLESIYLQTSEIDFEVIVCDNASGDGSVAMIQSRFPGVTVIENEKNIGFGPANNRGRAKATGEFVLFLNSDTVVLNNAIKIFYNYWKQHEEAPLGALGCILLDRDEQPTHSYGKFSSAGNELKEKVSPRKKKADQPCTPPAEVEYITGAALFMKNDQYAQFDERFFLYFDDSDLQLGLEKAGKKRIIIPGPGIIHFEGGSNSTYTEKTFQGSFSRVQFAISKIKYYKKRKDNPAAIFILKTLTVIKWLNPRIIRGTFKYFPELLKA
jgi:GT2 family glycosyltransferase